MSNKSKIIPLLKNIASRLWEGHAAVLVGAGFSRNAKPLSGTSRRFPMWNDLGDLFYEKVYCEKNTSKYSNVLKLGDEVQAAFGRATLDKLIIENVPDKEYEPSKLHSSLLSLPWVDVFTTNYDSLLERACVAVDSRKYDFVFNKNDLMNAERPRIIKLHGSFPSERPFIVTEEDYRRYPIDNSPFVNTVQQSLIENTLCLIGFSGDDPNFLSWIGWIRDNLGAENSPKIFMIGLFSFNEAQRKLLEKRNIVIVDLSLLDDFGDNHYEAHKGFIDFLIQSKGAENQFDWPTNDNADRISRGDSEEIINNKLKKCIAVWEQTKKNYPQWLITPEENRSKLWENTINWLQACSEEYAWENNLDLSFGFELVWRIDKSLLPIFDDVAEFLFKIIEQYKDFLFSQTKIKTDKEKEINAKLPSIIIGLLKYCRQESLDSKWNDLSSILTKHIINLTPETRAEYEYEYILQSYYLLNFEEARARINNWEINKQLPYHEVKRAGLLAEFGMLDEAITILEESLSIIRRNSLQSSKDNDYSSASQEAYVIFILRMFKHSWSLPDNERDLSNKYRSRLAYLSQYRCDPDNEFKYLEIRLESSLEHNATKVRSDFDLGRRTQTTNFGSGTTDSAALNSFNFLLLAENIGLPFHIPGCTIFGKTAVNAAKNIYDHCPQWSTFTILRVFNEKHFEYILSRNNLSTMGRTKAEIQFDKYYSKYENLISRQMNDKLDNSLDIEGSMLKVVPEILSRLITKVSFEKKEKIISLLCRLYNSKEFTGYDHTKNLLTRTINNLSLEQKLSLIPIFVDFPSQPINENAKHLQRFGFTNPFIIMLKIADEKNKYLSNVSDDKKISSAKIKYSLQEVRYGDDQVRQVSSAKLITLYKLGKLNKTDEKSLIKALWSKLDENGFPRESGYYSFFFLEDLKPESENVEEKLLHLIKQFSFPRQEGQGVSLTGGNSHYCNELVGSLSHMSFSGEDIELIISKLIEWYHSDKHYLDKKDEIHDEFLKRYKNIAFITTIILKKHSHLITENSKNEISSLLLEMKSKGVQVGRALTTLSIINNIPINEICADIKNQFYQTAEKHVIDAIESMYILLDLHIDLSHILLFLGQKLSWNHEPCVQESLSISLDIIKNRTIPLDSDFIQDILIGLHNIIEIDKNHESSNESILNHLEKKVKAAKLASYIYNQHIESGLEMPTILIEWKEACTSSDEFEEIRNAWFYKKE
ncbi:anti-phage defense-associated sirtuin Dsr2 [Scandinavium manionii]|uniref:anti-phage defense-associated sirtuin Dsr2 n=1 Tax=Scandinavium manionii TaxID=2926520 RepID=UPI0021651F72|nr:anti-phage defense-associated sirtuin Dsr2 [Scandinavium manionii]MCS2149325.1 SIR2 family protein [Scandinavium manionii]